MKKILYLSHDGMTDPLGQSQVLPYIAGLSKLGHQYTLISLEKSSKFKKLGSQIKSFCDTNNIEWIPFNYSDHLPVVKTIIDLRKIHRTILYLLKKQSFDLIHCRSYLTTMVALKIKQKYSIKVLFDMRGFWIDERVEGGVWNLSNPVFKLICKYLKAKEIELFNGADGIVSLTEKAVPTIRKIIKNTDPIIQVIPCCADVDFFSDSKVDVQIKNDFLNQWKISTQDKIIVYLGSLSTWYKPIEMFDFFIVYLKSNPSAKFLILTHDDASTYYDLAHKKGIPSDKIIITSATRNELPSILSICYASVFFIIPTFSKTASSPTKLAELLSMGIPVFCNSNVGDTDKIVEETKCGVVVHQFNEENYLQSIELFNKMNFDKNVLRQTAIDLFSLNVGVEKYLAIYQQLIPNNK